MAKNKLFISTVAVAVASSGLIPAGVDAATPTFSDVSKNNSHYDAIMELAKRGIIQGNGDGTFAPGKPVTRGQAAKMIAGALGLDTKNTGSSGFSDVPAKYEFAGAISVLQQLGVINGYGDGTFRPNDPISRNHMAVILTNALKLKPSAATKIPFTDVQENYKQAITALYQYGIAAGATSTTFDGNSPVTRGQLASFIVRAEKALTQAPAEVTIVVEGIEKGKLKTANKEFKIGSTVQSLLNEGNAQALAGASIKVKIVNGEIASVSAIELNISGAEGAPVTFDGGNTTLTGNMIINADFVELKNLVVTGNITLTGKAATRFDTNQLTVKGDLVVEDVKASPTATNFNTIIDPQTGGLTVIVRSGVLTNVTIDRPNTTIHSNVIFPTMSIFPNGFNSTINADIGILQLPPELQGPVRLSGTGTINQLNIPSRPNTPDLSTIPRPQFDLNWNGNINLLSILDTLIQIRSGQGTRIGDLIIPNGIDPLGIFSGIPNVNTIRFPNGAAVPLPASWAGSTSGGGSGGGSQIIPPIIPTLTPVQAMEAIKKAAEEFLRAEDLADEAADTDEEYYALMEQAILAFKTVFDKNASIAGFDLTSYKKLHVNAQKEFLFEWLLYGKMTIEAFSEIMEAMELNINLAFQALEAENADTPINMGEDYQLTAKQVLTEQFSYLGRSIGLEMETYDRLKLTSKGKVIDALLEIQKNNGTRFNKDIVIIQAALNKAVAEQLANEVSTAIQSINTAEDLYDIEDILDNYSFVLGINMAEYWNLPNENQEGVLKAILDAPEFTDAATLKNTFNAAVQTQIGLLQSAFLTAINGATTPEVVRDLLEENKDYIGLDVTNYNKILDVSDRLLVANAVVNNKPATGFSDVNQVKTVFTNAVQQQIQAKLQAAPPLTVGSEGDTVTIDKFGTKLYKLTLNAEQLYIFATVDANFDTTLTLYRLNGSKLEEIDFNDDGGNGNLSRIIYEPTSTGTYYIALKGFDTYNGTATVKAQLAASLSNNEATLGIIGEDAEASNPEIVTVELEDDKWLFIGAKAGSTVVTITDYAGREAKVPVTVAADGKVTIGAITKYSAVVNNSVANDEATLGLIGTTASSSDSEISTAAITGDGKVAITPVATGTATITVTNTEGRQATIQVTVAGNGTITIDAIKKYEVAKISNLNNDVETLGFVGTAVSSSDSEIATAELTEDGKVAITPIATGTATITVTNNDGRAATIVVTVGTDGTITIGTITKYEAKVTSAKWEKADGATDNLILTFSDAVNVADLTLALGASEATSIAQADYALSNENKTLTIKVADDQAIATAATITGVKYGNAPVTIEGQSITPQ